MILSELLQCVKDRGLNIIDVTGDTSKEVSDIVYDSRKVTKGCMFVCMKGAKSDGHSYASQVAENGAGVIIVEDDVPVTGPAIVKVDNSRKALALFAAAFYGYPAEKMKIIGITGTKGKTTTAHMIKSILEAAGFVTGMIGTNGAFVGKEKMETVNTTPESCELHRLFAWMLGKGCSHVVMEVSSQAYKLGRCEGIHYDIAAFLNISPDHIGEGEHADFEEYFSCKSKLFDNATCAVVNKHASRYQEMIKGVGENYKTVSAGDEADLYADNIKNTWEPGILGSVFTAHGELSGEFHLGIPGAFNVENALAAMQISLIAGADEKAIREGLMHIDAKGRMQLMRCASPITTLIIDYAHNAVSMEELLKTLRDYNPKKLTVMFGGGGNRAKARRYEMGEMAGKYADYVLITSDNCRMEDVNDINNDILVGLTKYDVPYDIIIDRKEAIHFLLGKADKDEIVVLAGKGHEEYQDIKGVKTHFSEQEIVEEYMQDWLAKNK